MDISEDLVSECKIATFSRLISLEGVSYPCFTVPVGAVGHFSPQYSFFQVVRGLVEYV